MCPNLKFAPGADKFPAQSIRQLHYSFFFQSLLVTKLGRIQLTKLALSSKQLLQKVLRAQQWGSPLFRRPTSLLLVASVPSSLLRLFVDLLDLSLFLAGYDLEGAFLSASFFAAAFFSLSCSHARRLVVGSNAKYEG